MGDPEANALANAVNPTLGRTDATIAVTADPDRHTHVTAAGGGRFTYSHSHAGGSGVHDHSTHAGRVHIRSTQADASTTLGADTDLSGDSEA